MAKIKLLHDFFKNRLTEKESHEVKGGRNYVPSNSGSNGYVNWDDIDIRNEGFVVNSNTPVILKVSKTSLNTFGN
jgi:hypothetical protein